MLLEFLDQTDSEYLFLVGDIIDGWRMRKKMYWHQEHNDVVQMLVRKEHLTLTGIENIMKIRGIIDGTDYD